MLTLIGSETATAQASSAAEHAKRGEDAVQLALKTKRLVDFQTACTNILRAVELVPDNQDYLVRATMYLYWKTEFTSNPELESYKYAEKAISLSENRNVNAFFRAALALDSVGQPGKARSYAAKALEIGGLHPDNQKIARDLIKTLAPRKSVIANTLSVTNIWRQSGRSAGKEFFYYPVPPKQWFNQTAEYSVGGAAKWEAVEKNGDTFLKIWPGSAAVLQLRMTIERRSAGRAESLVEDHSKSLPPEIMAFAKATRFIDAGSPGIQTVAKSLRRTTWTDTARAIADYVNHEIKYVYAGGSEKSSSLVLQSKRGMCMDMANLSVALARANGIPARMVLGSQPWNENNQFAGLTTGHVWAEVYIPGTGWCEFDPAVPQYFGMTPPQNIRWYWRDTQVMQDTRNSGGNVINLDLPLVPPMIDLEMERTKYVQWFGFTDEWINQVGSRWKMTKEW